MAGPGTIRTFDAPEAMGIQFMEVEAKSALNRVPGNGLPFNWTVNPYRGCTHACSYCISGDTRVLMGDGRHRSMRDLRAGDIVYGTVRDGDYRRYVRTEVRDHWRTVKPGYRISLKDGTVLVASGDHRFLSNRGWKYVVGTQRGPHCRPHLTTNNKLIGVGGFGAIAEHDEDYRRGYLSGMVRGDGHLASYSLRAGGKVSRRRPSIPARSGG